MAYGFSMDAYIWRKELGIPNPITCRCCGKVVNALDGHPIHTACIPKHWSKHARGINASRCKEFKTQGGK